MSLDKINNKEKFAQGEVNVLKIDSEKLIDQVAKKFKAEILAGKRKNTDESIMEGLYRDYIEFYSDKRPEGQYIKNRPGSKI